MVTVPPPKLFSAQDTPRITLYQEVCNNYRTIDDYRTKLLGFLPLVSGAGIYFLLNNSVTSLSGNSQTTAFSQFLLPIGIVGAIITLGIYIYDLRAIQIKVSLVKTGRDIEDLLGINGQFKRRPHTRFGVINDLGGSSLVYTALIAGWLFLGLILTSPLAAWIVSIGLFLIGVVVVAFSGRIETFLYHVQEQESGKATIEVGQQSIQVPTNAVRTGSTITIMPIKSNTISVTGREPGRCFTVELAKTTEEPVVFEWMIIN
jgi:hypothetical protein